MSKKCKKVHAALTPCECLRKHSLCCATLAHVHRSSWNPEHFSQSNCSQMPKSPATHKTSRSGAKSSKPLAPNPGYPVSKNISQTPHNGGITDRRKEQIKPKKNIESQNEAVPILQKSKRVDQNNKQKEAKNTANFIDSAGQHDTNKVKKKPEHALKKHRSHPPPNEDNTKPQPVPKSALPLWDKVAIHFGFKKGSETTPAKTKKPSAQAENKTRSALDSDFVPKQKYPRDIVIQLKIEKEEDQIKKTHSMVRRATNLIVVTTMKRLCVELSVEFEGEKTSGLCKDILRELEKSAVAIGKGTVLKGVKKILDSRHISDDFEVSKEFQPGDCEKWLPILFVWGLYMHMKHKWLPVKEEVCSPCPIRQENYCKEYVENNFDKSVIDKWIQQTWFFVLFQNCEDIDFQNSRSYSEGICVTKMKSRIYEHILTVSKAMCVSQAVQAGIHRKVTGGKELQSEEWLCKVRYKREHERANYVADYLFRMITNAVRLERSPRVDLDSGREKAKQEEVDDRATEYLRKIIKLKTVKYHSIGCQFPIRREKVFGARAYVLFSILLSIAVGSLNLGSRDNIFERVMDSTGSATLLLVTVFGALKIQSDDPNALRNIFYGRKITSSFRDVARYVYMEEPKWPKQSQYDDDDLQQKLTFLFHLVEDDRLWMSSNGTCYVRGKTGGAVVPSVRVKGKNIAEAGSIFGNGALLAPDWETFYAVTGNNHHATMEQEHHVKATDLKISDGTEFSGKRIMLRETLLEAYNLV